ncbi:FadR/GntR family transcriptional regulator [Streptacidiphilus sp. P02-A3a]|uniref:FadR/GntR family transcriptional regulator n=1 Tax=Streptacidiphilus sp. P02-A3a TaxID=2704468 RepID=UPI0015FC0E43|nr:FCD domain-containing protein [Streptacidiphilus sp. P02-A3a]QMU71911.1 FadR family transcriptional regulator [Streptacidiphilus sp. P02-A3a]
MTLTSPKREPLADQVIAQLRAQITSGEWPVGSRIPTEVELVEQLGVARNTVREAVRALAHNGLLDIRQGSGTYVLATSELAGVMHRRFADADHDQVIELRLALEAAAARLAATRRTSADLKLLDTALARREDAWTSGDVEDFIQTDAAFHQAVMAAAHNEVISALYADLGEVLRTELRQTVGPVLTENRYVSHTGILAAIREGDPEKASLEASAALTVC